MGQALIQSHGFSTLKIYWSSLSEIKWVWASPGGILCFVINTSTCFLRFDNKLLQMTYATFDISWPTDQPEFLISSKRGSSSSSFIPNSTSSLSGDYYMILHVCMAVEEPLVLTDQLTVARVNRYLVDLHCAFQQVKLPHKSRQYWWHSVLTHRPEAFDHLVVAFNLR
ncbi:hypothetical protein PSHT_12499 [Puccinia striiformis]|uniref:Uncharacterized protein n=1 Tax=Puccinia striiformis TaxID=27350 RepID=A0A2S4UW50_9BASI|nr:hypothetical protein PSHT_12499 [Puccinia striiformis]